MYESITVDDLLTLNSPNIIDIRSNSKYNSGHIMGARNVSYEQLLLYPNQYLNKVDIYYIYCDKGIQSKNICVILNNMGYQTINVTGGYSSYLLKKGRI